MQYCPKCKTEYEDHAEICVDCEIPLVSDLENEVYMQNLIRVKKGDIQRLSDYLIYSGFEKFETEDQENDMVLIKIAIDDFEKANDYIKVYIQENMEEDSIEDYYLDEYAVEAVDTATTVSDMKSTVYTFGLVGAGLIVVAVLNFLEILVIQGFNKTMLTAVLGVLGIGFVIVAVKTKGQIGHKEISGNEMENKIAKMMATYKGTNSMTDFYGEHNIKREEVDDGALYFVVFDLIKKEVKRMYPDESDTIVNTVVERLYDEIADKSQ